MAKALRHDLDRCLAGDLTLSELQDRLVDTKWNMEATASREAVLLVRDVELALAESTSGYLTREELRADLSAIAHPPKAAISA